MRRIAKLGLLVVIVAVIAYFGWGKLEEILVSRVITKKLAEAGMTPEVLKKLDETGFQADPQVLAKIATGGQPMGRWKEGLMFDGIEPMPWLEERGELVSRNRRGSAARDSRYVHGKLSFAEAGTDGYFHLRRTW